MSRIDWHIQGFGVTSCNCAWGCPCQFMSSPTEGHCRAAVGYRVARGHFGATRLDGLAFAGLFAWPGPIHEGGGEAQPIVDARADAAQREALLAILSGQETEPGATIFSVFAATFSRVHPPLFQPIAIEADFAARSARISVEGLVDARVEALKNPITGEAVHARIALPAGFEYNEAEVASGSVRTGGAPIRLEWRERHAHLAELDMTGAGVVRRPAR